MVWMFVAVAIGTALAGSGLANAAASLIAAAISTAEPEAVAAIPWPLTVMESFARAVPPVTFVPVTLSPPSTIVPTSLSSAPRALSMLNEIVWGVPALAPT